MVRRISDAINLATCRKSHRQDFANLLLLLNHPTKHIWIKMKKVIAAFNMTLDGVCDHTAGIATEELHQHYSELVNNAGIILYGRTTYQLMQFWQTLLHNPSGKKSMDDFAISINKIPKLVFSNTLKETDWQSAEIAKRPLAEEVLELRQQSAKDILVGSRSLIIQLLNSHLIDEFQICVHPVIAGKGLLLFEQIKDRIVLRLNKTKSLNSGAIVLYYEPTIEKRTYHEHIVKLTGKH